MAGVTAGIMGNNLRRERMMRGLTAQQLSERTGGSISAAQIGRYERGERDMTGDEISGLAVALGCDIQAIIHGIDPRKPKPKGGRMRMLSAQSSAVMEWVASEWEGDADALITAFGYYAAVPGRYRKYAMMELLSQKDAAIAAGAMAEEDIPDCVKAGIGHVLELLGGLYDE